MSETNRTPTWMGRAEQRLRRDADTLGISPETLLRISMDTKPIEAQLTDSYAEAMNRVAEAINRLADAYLYVNQQEDEPSFEGQSLSDRGHL